MSALYGLGHGVLTSFCLQVREEVFNEEESDTEPEEEPNYSASDSDNDVSEADLMEDGGLPLQSDFRLHPIHCPVAERLLLPASKELGFLGENG